MKTKNNVQKTATRAAAVIVSFVLVSLTVTAQDFWKTVITNSSFNKIALAMVETSKKVNAPEKTKVPETAYYFNKNETDTELSIENWMMGNDYFKPAVLFTSEKETSLRVEEWMFNESLFSKNKETEAGLKTEAWMIDNKAWY